MNRAWKSLGVFVVLATLSGCADGWDPIVRSWNVWINEVCDTFLLAKDNASAKQLLEGQCKLLDAKFEKLRDQSEKKFQAAQQRNDKEEFLELENAGLDYYDESLATLKRFDVAVKRLDDVIKNSPENDYLKKLRNLEWGITKIELSGTPLDPAFVNDKNKFGGVLIPRPKKGK